MNRERLASVLVAVLAVLALAVGAASIDAPTHTAGTGGGSGGGTGGFLGHGSTFDLGQSSPESPTNGGFPKIIPQAFIAALFVAFLVALYLRRDEIGLGDLRRVAVVVAILGVLLVAGYLFLGLFGAGNPAGQNGTMGRSAPAVPGGGTSGSADTALRPVSTDLPLVALAVGAILVVGLAVAFRSGDDDTPSEDETEPADPTGIAEVGRAAGRAADRITGDAPVENEVYRAWREMTTQLDVANPDSSTPREFARAATDAGMSPRDVTELTDLFRTVRYGDSPITNDRETRAVAALRRIEDAYAEES